MITQTRIRNNLEFWADRKTTKYPTLWCAKAPTRRPRPEVVKHAMSACFEDGWRTFGFETEQARDEFLLDYQFCGAEICDDPLLSAVNAQFFGDGKGALE